MKLSAREALDRVPLFVGLDREVRESLADRLVHMRLGRGETLFREGDPGEALYSIESGEVRVLTRNGIYANQLRAHTGRPFCDVLASVGRFSGVGFLLPQLALLGPACSRAIHRLKLRE